MAIKKIDHIVITTEHPQECLAFYQKLGFCVGDAGGRYELFAGDFKINVHVKGAELVPHAAQVMPGSVDVCFETDEDIDALRKNLAADGIGIELGVVRRQGVKKEMDSIYMRDPDGNLIEICCYR